eukprot:7280214-Pyramimonas_sp.AAC.1
MEQLRRYSLGSCTTATLGVLESASGKTTRARWRGPMQDPLQDADARGLYEPLSCPIARRE